MSAKKHKPKLAVWKFASCDGCQLSILDCEDELLKITEIIEIANFPEASRAIQPGPYDISLVEGSITTPHDAERIHKIRRQSKVLITIGACATSGGIQALRNFVDVNNYVNLVYANPKFISSLQNSTPISHHIYVDYELRGCPINKYQLIEVINAFVNNRKPNIPNTSVCIECKRKSVTCVMVSQGQPCLGPVTHAGCQALCPSYNRPCFGCYGPKEAPNTSSLADQFKELGFSKYDIIRAFRGFNAYSDAFRKESETHEK